MSITKAPVKANLIDKVIEYFAPQTALQRQLARTLLSHGYEGATRGGRLQNWRTSSTDANSALRNDLPLLRDRSRDLVRNNVFANVARRKVIANTVGKGIVADIKGNDRVKELWDSWAGTTDCDINGELNFYGLQGLIMGTVVDSGSCLVRIRYRRPTNDNKFPIELQILEPDFLDKSKDTIGTVSSGQNQVINGIEYNSRGKAVAYWIYKNHPGDSSSYLTTESVKVDASEIIHVYRKDRAGQTVGVPWLTPALLRLHDFHEYENAQIVRQKIAACFAGFMRTPGNKDTFQRFKEKNDKEGFVEKIEPGMMELLPPGWDIVFSSPPRTADDYSDTSSLMLHGIAAGIGIPYEVLTGDLSQVNFSSARLGWIEFQKEIDIWREHLIKNNLIAKIWKVFLENVDLLDINTNGLKVTWIEPRRALLDPDKEIRATVSEIRAGLVPLSEAIRGMGRDPDDVLNEIAATNKKLTDMGIVLDTDPRVVSSAGISQPNLQDTGNPV